MAYDFTRSVTDPRDLYPSGAGATNDSTAAAIGAGLSGLANIFDVGMKVHKENQSNKNLLAVENDINPLVQAVSQGRMTSREFDTRASAILSSHINRTPSDAQAIRERVQQISGRNPSGHILAAAETEEQIQRERKQNEQNYYLGVAQQFGAIPLNETTKEPDYEEGIAVGRELAQYQANIKAASEEADLEIKRRRLSGKEDPASLADQLKLREIAISDAVAPMIQANINAHINNVPALLSTLENPKDADDLAVGQRLVEQSYTQTREAVLAQLADVKGVTTEIRANILKQVDDAYESYRGRTPNTIKNAVAIVQQQGTFARSEAWRVIPDLMAASELVGDGPAANAFRAEMLAPTKSGAEDRVEQGRRVQGFLKNFQRVAQGNPPPTDPGNPAEARSLANAAKAVVDTAAKSPEKVQDKQLPGIANSLGFEIDKALESQDPDDYLAAMESGNSAGTARNLERLKTTNPELYDASVQKVIQLNADGILALGRRASETTTTSILDKVSEGLRATEAGGQPPSGREMSQHGLVYNAETGSLEISSKGKTPPKDLIRLRDAMNKSLGTLLRYKDQMPDNIKDVTDQELKKALMEGAGIPVKGQTPESQEVQVIDDTNPTESLMRQGNESSSLPNPGVPEDGLITPGGIKKPDPSDVPTTYELTEDGIRYEVLLPTVKNGKPIEDPVANYDPNDPSTFYGKFDTNDNAQKWLGKQSMTIDPKVLGGIESGNNPNAVGPETKYGTAKGEMQVLDAVAKNPGYGVTPAKDDSIAERDRVGRDLIRVWSEKYGDTVALVAYNWGPGNVDKWIKNGMQWSDLPEETQKYVGRYYLEHAKRAR